MHIQIYKFICFSSLSYCRPPTANKLNEKQIIMIKSLDLDEISISTGTQSAGNLLFTLQMFSIIRIHSGFAWHRLQLTEQKINDCWPIEQDVLHKNRRYESSSFSALATKKNYLLNNSKQIDPVWWILYSVFSVRWDSYSFCHCSWINQIFFLPISLPLLLLCSLFP